MFDFICCTSVFWLDHVIEISLTFVMEILQDLLAELIEIYVKVVQVQSLHRAKE